MVKNDKYFLVVILFVLISGTVIHFWPQIKQIKLFNSKNEDGIQSELAQLREQIKLLSQNNSNTNSINNSNVNTVTTQQLQNKIQELSNQPKQKVSVIGSSNSTYNSFIPYIVQISCLNSDGNGSLGSGTIISPNTILTNYHVIKGYRQCIVGFTNNAGYIGAETVIGDITGTDSGRDRAIITVKSSLADKTIKKCNAEDVKIGDDLRIMGYPAVGSSVNITVTRGIVSSFDKGYIVTDAKASSGNSGGASIHSSGCFLGIPTIYLDPARYSGIGDGLLYIVNETIGNGLNDSMQSVSGDEQYQQEVVEKQEMTAQQKADKEYYDKFVLDYNAIMSLHAKNMSNLSIVFSNVINEQFSYAAQLLDEYKKVVVSPASYLNNFYNFCIFNNITDLRNEVNMMFSNMSCTMDNLRDYAVYANANNYDDMIEQFNEYKKCYDDLLGNEKRVRSLFNSINSVADNYFN